MAAGVLRIKIHFGQVREFARHAAAGDRVRLTVVVALGDDPERFHNFVDRLHRRILASGLDLLAVVLVHVAKLALFVFTEVLADAIDGEIQQVSPLDVRRDLDQRLAARKTLGVIRRLRAKSNAREPRAFRIPNDTRHLPPQPYTARLGLA